MLLYFKQATGHLVLYDGDEDFILLHQEVVFTHQTCRGVLVSAGTVAVGKVGVTVTNLEQNIKIKLRNSSALHYLVAIIRDEKVRSGSKYRSTVRVVGDCEHFLLDVKLPDVQTAGAMETEEEGVVRGHITALASRGS